MEKFKRGFQVCLLVLLVLVSYLSVLPFPVYAQFDPSLVGTSISLYATADAFQRKTFFANGRHWVFYSGGTNMVYSTSTDGATWSAATTVRAGSSGVCFSVFFDGTYVHYAFSTGASGASLYYRRGTPNADGTITWSAVEQTVQTAATGTYLSFPFVSVDSNGYPWISYRKYDGTNYLPWVTKSSTNDGTWTTATNFPYYLTLTSSGYWRVIIIPLTAGKMLAVYARNGDTVKAKRWDGSAWGAEVATTSALTYSNVFSAVAQVDDVHLTFNKATTYDVLYTKYSYATNAWGAETTIQAATGTTAPVISIDTATNDLYVFWSGYPTANHIYYRKYTASTATWETAVDWISETETLTNNYRLTCFYQASGSNVGLAYMTKTASPYNVKYAYLSLAAGDTAPPTYSNVATNTTIAGQPCQFSVLWNDNVNVSGYIFGTNNTGTWINDTWVSFSVYYNSTAAWSNVTKTLNSTVGVRVEWQVWCNDTSNNWNTTGTQYIVTTGLYQREASGSVSVSSSVSWFSIFQRSLTQPFQLSITASRTLTVVRAVAQQTNIVSQVTRNLAFTRLTQTVSNIISTVTRTMTSNRQASIILAAQSSAARLLSLQRQSFQLVSIDSFVSRILNLQRQITQSFLLNSLATRTVSFVRTQTQLFNLVIDASRIESMFRQASQLVPVTPSTSRLLSFQRQILEPFSISSIVSRILTLTRTSTVQPSIIFSATRIQTFARSASAIVTNQFSTVRWQSLSRTANTVFQIISTALGEKKGLYERFVSQTVSILSSATRTLGFSRLNLQPITLVSQATRNLAFMRYTEMVNTIISSVTRTLNLQRQAPQQFLLDILAARSLSAARLNWQSITIQTIIARSLSASRTAINQFTFILSVSSQKITYAIIRTVDLSIIINTVGQRTHVSLTRTATAMFQFIISVNRWAFPLLEGVPSGPITTPNFQVTVESFTYSLNVFANQLQTKATVKFQPLNSFDGNVTLHYWITDYADTTRLAYSNMTIPTHTTDRDPTIYTLTLDTPIFMTAVTNDRLIWHLNAEYNNITTSETRIQFTPLPWLKQIKPFTPYILIILALAFIYIVFFKSE